MVDLADFKMHYNDSDTLPSDWNATLHLEVGSAIPSGSLTRIFASFYACFVQST